MYDLEDLTAFATVMQTGNLSTSARQLEVSKSTVSRRISQLEAQVGQPLLRRQSNRLLPTEAGNLFLSYCQQILSLAEQSRRVLDDLSGEVSGEMTAHVHSVFARGWFSRRLEEFLDSYPEVSLELRTQLRPPSGPDDTSLCLWLGEVEECGLRQETLGHLPRGIYAHPNYLAQHGTPNHPRELSNHAWVDLLGDTQQGLQLHHAHEGIYEFMPPLSRLRVDQDVFQSDAIARGQGLGILPDWLVERRLRAHPGTMIRCLEDWHPPAQPIVLLYPFGRLPRKMVSLIDHLRRAVPAAWRNASSACPLTTLLHA